MAERTTQRARLSPETRKADLLRIARKVFAETGHEDFLPSVVAERAGVSEATIYRYFPTKRDLLVSVAEDWLDEILVEEPEFTGEALAQLRQAVRYSLFVVRREPALTRFIITVLRADPNYRSMEVYQLNRRFAASITRVIENAVKAGVFRDGVSPRLVRDMILGAVEMQTWTHLRGGLTASVEEESDAIAGILYRGMLAPAPETQTLELAVDAIKQSLATLEAAVLARPGAKEH